MAGLAVDSYKLRASFVHELKSSILHKYPIMCLDLSEADLPQLRVLRN